MNFKTARQVGALLSVAVATVSSAPSAQAGCEGKAPSLQEFISLFKPATAVLKSRTLQSHVTSRYCHTLTGCQDWTTSEQTPQIRYHHESLWQCSECSSVRSLGEASLIYSLPGSALETSFLLSARNLTFDMHFGGARSEFTGNFHTILDQRSGRFPTTDYNLNAVEIRHSPDSCSRVGMTKECNIGNYYDRGEFFIERATFGESRSVAVTAECTEIRFEAQETPDDIGFYHEYVWTLDAQGPLSNN